ncbi:MAG: NAD(P)/FAD-dependent oxidoreductase [Anaerolineaceae bacterium]|nr:MAG: NAD(P)/FAD-dependent oxidoreductase [Anaerolineaceae bacterium]
MQNVDILILGAGPAGLSTALHLARDFPHLTTRVLILDKARHPRPKLCAGGLVRDAETILARLGLDVTEVPHVDASAAHFDFEGSGLSIRNRKSHTLRVIRRNEFDAWLAGKVRERGMEIREEVTVKDVTPDDDGVTVVTDQGEFRAQVVVGADGSKGVTRRCVLPREPVHTARVLEVITPTQPSPIFSENGGGQGRGREGAYFDFSCVPSGIEGYTWDFPTQIQGQPMRCWGIYDANLHPEWDKSALKETLAEEMSRHGFDLGDYELQGHPIRWYAPWTSISVPRVLLAGDAAGADPLFGEGISMALGYGAVASAEIGESFQRGDFSFRRYPRRVARSGLGQTLLVRWVVARVVYKFKWRWFQILLWHFLKPVVAGTAWLLVLNWAGRLPNRR